MPGNPIADNGKDVEQINVSMDDTKYDYISEETNTDLDDHSNHDRKMVRQCIPWNGWWKKSSNGWRSDNQWWLIKIWQG